MYDVLQHVENREKALQECLRVTNTKGVICVIEVNSRGAKYYRDKEAIFDIKALDLSEYIFLEDVSSEVVPSDFSDAYILRKLKLSKK